MDAQYGPLSAEFYQISKPLDADYPDVPYYLEELQGTKGAVLEIGAGTGRLIVPLAEAGLRIEALEPSPYMRAWLEKNLKARKLKVPLHAHAAEEPTPKNGFAAVLVPFGSFQLFQPRETALACLKNFHKMLAKNGRLYIDIDVIRPEPHKAGLLTHGTRVDCSDGSSILIQGSRRWDFVEQLEHVFLRYEKWKKGQLVATELQDFSLRAYGQWEFASLLKESGFKKIRMSGDYGNPEIHGDTQTFCFVAEV